MIAYTWASGSMRRTAGLAALGLLLAAAGCTTRSNEAAKPASQAPNLEVTVADPDAPAQTVTPATSPDGYPSFSGPLTAANVQMTNEEATDLQSRLTALGAARKAGTISEAEYQKRLLALRKLAAEHGAETQAQIAK
ncbi:SHOCT domain-containing protein [Rhizobium sp. S-51]|uniref:SHOCT domain-containing protein n=1 Tax=Rhizobium terricola TaxID=2728849 RepID=A0A7Y0AUU3_9HYPH|nr:SHOCT domain-containing protein [Rhizobium terricola]NML73805.1 SHOCT domain-containing protein [Rhizobium terricola]